MPQFLMGDSYTYPVQTVPLKLIWNIISFQQPEMWTSQTNIIYVNPL